MDAFSRRIFGGNQAGVVLPDRPLDDSLCCAIAAEFKHSETAFVTVNADKSVTLRYFTPAGEVDLCGHATIAGFALLRQLGRIGDGAVAAHTRAADLTVTVSGDTVWMDMAPPRLIRTIKPEELPELYGSYGLNVTDCPDGFLPQIVSTGLADIMMPVKNHDILMKAVQNAPKVTELSRRNDCVGVHMFCPGEDVTYCSNFAPLYDIPEECATGTSNGALTYYLYLRGLVQPGAENVFLQGEHMGRPSEIRSKLLVGEDGAVSVKVGGSAVMSMECELKI